MGAIREHEPVLRFMAVFSRHEEAIHWARQRAVEAWGPVELESEWFPFEETSFYEKSMGAELTKVLFAFSQLMDPADLPAVKHETNRWEEEYRLLRPGPEPRPLNLDPGYVTEAKLVLATTKDRDHRIYLAQGIYAENTVVFHRGSWQNRPWTYPDYQRPDYHQFLERCRDHFRRSKRKVRK